MRPGLSPSPQLHLREPPPASDPPDVRHAGASDVVIEVDPAPGVTDRAASVIDVDALHQPVDAGVNEASI